MQAFLGRSDFKNTTLLKSPINHKIADAFIAAEDVPNFVKVISTEEAAKNDFNLSPSRYVGAATDETYREIPEIVAELRTLEQKATKITKELDGILQQLKLS